MISSERKKREEMRCGAACGRGEGAVSAPSSIVTFEGKLLTVESFFWPAPCSSWSVSLLDVLMLSSPPGSMQRTLMTPMRNFLLARAPVEKTLISMLGQQWARTAEKMHVTVVLPLRR